MLLQTDTGFALCDVVGREAVVVAICIKIDEFVPTNEGFCAKNEGFGIQNDEFDTNTQEDEAVVSCGLSWGERADVFSWMSIELPPGGLPKLALIGTDSVFHEQAAPEPAPIVHWPRAGKTGRLIARLHADKIVRNLMLSASYIHAGDC